MIGYSEKVSPMTNKPQSDMPDPKIKENLQRFEIHYYESSCESCVGEEYHLSAAEDKAMNDALRKSVKFINKSEKQLTNEILKE